MLMNFKVKTSGTDGNHVYIATINSTKCKVGQMSRSLCQNLQYSVKALVKKKIIMSFFKSYLLIF